jgi:hypothetical protein
MSGKLQGYRTEKKQRIGEGKEVPLQIRPAVEVLGSINTDYVRFVSYLKQ